MLTTEALNDDRRNHEEETKEKTKKKPFRRDLGDMKWVKAKNITFAYNINETIVNQCLS